MGNKNDKKERINVVYSTNPNYQYEYNQEKEQETLAPENKTYEWPLIPNNAKAKQLLSYKVSPGRKRIWKN